MCKKKCQVFSSLKTVCLSGVLMMPVIGVAADSPPDVEWQVGPRTVPVPAGASAMIQKTLAEGGQPSIQARLSEIPSSDEAARALVAKRDKKNSEKAQALAKRMNVKVEEDTIKGVKVFWMTPDEIAPEFQNSLFVQIHGGAYVVGAGMASTPGGIVVANTAKIKAMSIDYRMPPDHPFPAAVDDVVAVYKQLLKKYSHKKIAIGGGSAGGGLSLASVHKMKALGLKTPAAIIAGTPWADLTKTSDSLYTLEGIDRALVTYDGPLAAAAQAYANGHDMKDPLISPVYGDFSDFPPTHLVTGTRDLFLSDTARTHRALRKAGAIADLTVFEGISHGEHLSIFGSPESQEYLAEVAEFLKRYLN